MRLLKTIGLMLGIGAALYFLFIFFIVSKPSLDNYSNRAKFDSEKWKNWRESEEEMSLRWNMITDLEDNYKLKGMTDEEIVDLLGVPETKSNTEWTYYLGMAGHGIDTGTLSLTFDKGKVRSYEITRG
jgi:hypothetical protein